MKGCFLLLTLLYAAHINLSAQVRVADTLNRIYSSRPASLGIIGDTIDVNTKTSAGTVLMGGGKDVDEAFKWMLQKSGGGNIVFIRASGTNAYNAYATKLGTAASVETLKIDSRELAENDEVVRIIRNAEMLFIAGGDQSAYMKYWKHTKTMDALNYLLNVKKIPVGGTSAGCAILSGLYYSGETGSAVSKVVLNDPYDSTVTLYKNDFLNAPYLSNMISDQHYVTRSRQGRHVTFLARMVSEGVDRPRGIAADERTAVCIDQKGQASVIGSGNAYFLITGKSKKPEQCNAGKPLNWVSERRALSVYELPGTTSGTGTFDVKKFKARKAKGGKWMWWWVASGELKQQYR